MRILPEGTSPEARLLLTARGLRGFADGVVSVLLASYLSDLGFSPGKIGVLITGTLLGSAALTLATGLASVLHAVGHIRFVQNLLRVNRRAGKSRPLSLRIRPVYAGFGGPPSFHLATAASGNVS